jgi:hypothetical protein
MEFAVIFAVLLLLSIGGAVLKAKMAKSPTFGKECPFCKVRGQIESKEIERNYLENVTRRTEGLALLGDPPWTEEFKRYMVTFHHQCKACGKDWTSSTEQLKEDAFANFSRVLGDFVDK